MSSAVSLRERLNRSGGEVDAAKELPIPGFVRVDLLPKTVAERERVRQAKKIAIVAVGTAVVGLGGLWFLAQMDAAGATEELNAAEATGAQLQGQLAQLAEVPAAFAAASTAQQAMNATMGDEVRWSFLLNQLSFSTPSGVTLEGISGTTGTSELATQADPAAGAESELLPVVSPVGSMTFTGQADSFSKVASWLDSLSVLQDYTYPFFTNATESEESDFGSSVQFESSAELTDQALSGRYGESSVGQSTQPTPSPSAGTAEQGAAS